MSLANLEKGLTIYYTTFRQKYDNEFTKALEPFDMDEDDLKDEFENDAADFTLSDFDEAFPLYPAIEDETERSNEIFRICNHCYKTGQPPQIVQPPRGMKQKIPFCYWYQVCVYIRVYL